MNHGETEAAKKSDEAKASHVSFRIGFAGLEGKLGHVADALLRAGCVGRGHQLINVIPDAASGAEILFGQPPVDLIIQTPALRWVAVMSAGYNRYDSPDFWRLMERRGIAFTNASSAMRDVCTEHILALMLALNRRLPQSLETQRKSRNWPDAEARRQTLLLKGQVVVILGFGVIGRSLARALRPFGAVVHGIRRHPAGSVEDAEIHSESALRHLLPIADHVVNVLPLRDTTRQFMNRERLSWCRAGSFFYNIGRGGTVDQEALIEALHSGRLAAAYLDVMEPEPLPADHQLWSTPNCFLTPHVAGDTPNQDEVCVQHFLANLTAFARGELLSDRVN